MNEVEDQLDTPRDAQQIAKRSIVLCSVVAVAQINERETSIEWLKEENLWDELSPQETKFLTTDTWSEKDCVRYTWQVECLIPMLWAIQKIDAMPGLDEECDGHLVTDVIVAPYDDTEDFIQSAALRPADVIQKAYEQVHRAHWEARKPDFQDTARLNLEVIQERHYGFNYVIGYEGLAWDDITTDT